MKKILANVFSLRGVLTVLCVCMASEALADVAYPPPYYIRAMHILLYPIAGISILPVVLQISSIIEVFLIVLIIRGSSLQGFDISFMRGTQLLLQGIELILWGVAAVGGLIGPRCNLLLLICFMLNIAASLLSGLWTYRKQTDTSPDSSLKKQFICRIARGKKILLYLFLISAAIIMFYMMADSYWHEKLTLIKQKRQQGMQEMKQEGQGRQRQIYREVCRIHEPLTTEEKRELQK